MKYIELFAGVGGFRNGIEQARPEWKCKFANEWDKYAASVYRKQYGEKEINTKDITTISARDIPEHNLLVCGFPCQTFSIAGKRRGFEDTRGTLFFDVARILQEKRPRFVVLENVKGLLSHESGKTFQRILGILANLRYRVEWEILNSKHFGVPQNRERVFIVGYSGEGRFRKIFPLQGCHIESNVGGSVCGEHSASRTLTANYGDISGDGTKVQIVASRGRYDDKDTTEQKYEVNKEGISNTITGVQKDNLVVEGVKDDLIKTSKMNPQGARVYDPDGASITLSSQGGGHGAKTGLYVFPITKGGDVHTIDANYGKGIHKPEKHTRSQVVDGLRVRRLTPVETERLQAFPDSWTEIGLVDGKEYEVSDSQRYKMMGNAVTTTVVAAVIKKLGDVYGIK